MQTDLVSALTQASIIFISEGRFTGGLGEVGFMVNSAYKQTRGVGVFLLVHREPMGNRPAGKWRSLASQLGWIIVIIITIWTSLQMQIHFLKWLASLLKTLSCILHNTAACLLTPPQNQYFKHFSNRAKLSMTQGANSRETAYLQTWSSLVTPKRTPWSQGLKITTCIIILSEKGLINRQLSPPFSICG